MALEFVFLACDHLQTCCLISQTLQVKCSVKGTLCEDDLLKYVAFGLLFPRLVNVTSWLL